MPVDEPAITHDPPIGQPVLDDSNIKAMAAKFKAEWKGAPADGKVGSGAAAKDEPKSSGSVDKTAGGGDKPSQQASTEKVSQKLDGSDKGGSDTAKPGESSDEPDMLPSEPLNRERWKKLYQSKESHKARAEALKAERETLAAKAAQLEADLAKTKAALPPNLEEVQKAIADAKRIADENKALQETLETVNFEKSPRFKNWWETETSKHIKVGQSHIPPAQREEFAKLLLAPSSPERNAALDAIVEPLPPTSKRLATGALEAIESLKIQREEALTRGSEKWKELQAHEQAEAKAKAAAATARLQQISDEAVRRAKAAYTAFQPTGDATKDGEIAQREAFVRAVVAGQLDQDAMLNIPAAAVESLYLKETVIPSLKAELAKQSELIKQLQSSTPRASDGTRGGGKASDAKAGEKGTSFADTVLANWSGKK